MKVILVLMALGGYNSNTPAFTQIETSSVQSCTDAGNKLIKDFESVFEGNFSDENRYGPDHISFSCVEIK